MSPIRRARGLPDGRVGMQAALVRAVRTARALSSRLWVAPLGMERAPSCRAGVYRRAAHRAILIAEDAEVKRGRRGWPSIDCLRVLRAFVVKMPGTPALAGFSPFGVFALGPKIEN